MRSCKTCEGTKRRREVGISCDDSKEHVSVWCEGCGARLYDYDRKRQLPKPQKDLSTLRMSVARIAQFLGVESEALGMKLRDIGHQPLCELCDTQERGWNALCAGIICKLGELGITPANDPHCLEVDGVPACVSPHTVGVPGDLMQPNGWEERPYTCQYDTKMEAEEEMRRFVSNHPDIKIRVVQGRCAKAGGTE